MNPLRIGIQLYSVAPPFEADAHGTLRALAEMGYEGVEFAWKYGGLAPKALRGLLDELGLVAAGIYAPIAQLADPSSEAHRYAVALDAPFLTTGLQGRANEHDWPDAIETVRAAAGAVAGCGRSLLYHNHREELAPVGGRLALESLLDATDPALVRVELDTAYFVDVGLDPADWIRRCAGRIPLLHARDTGPGRQSVPVGAGLVDFAEVVAAARTAGVEWLICEQNPAPDAIPRAEESLRALRRIVQGDRS